MRSRREPSAAGSRWVCRGAVASCRRNQRGTRESFEVIPHSDVVLTDYGALECSLADFANADGFANLPGKNRPARFDIHVRCSKKLQDGDLFLVQARTGKISACVLFDALYCLDGPQSWDMPFQRDRRCHTPGACYGIAGRADAAGFKNCAGNFLYSRSGHSIPCAPTAVVQPATHGKQLTVLRRPRCSLAGGGGSWKSVHVDERSFRRCANRASGRQSLLYCSTWAPSLLLPGRDLVNVICCSVQYFRRWSLMNSEPLS